MADDSVPPTPWRQAASGRRARKSEEQAARDEGGRRQPSSGSKWFAKGDVRANGFLIEDRLTDNASYSITAKEWLKITQSALQTPPGLRPQMRLTIAGLPRLRVMTEDDYLYMVAQIGDQ
jgi:hypothetical protein